MKVGIQLSGVEDIKRMFAELGENAADAARLTSNMIGEHMQFAMRQEIPKRFQFRGTSDAFKRSIVLEKASKGKMTTVAGLGRVVSFQRRTGVREVATLVVGSDVGGTKSTATRNLGVILARHEEAGARSSGEAYRAGNKTFIGGFFIPSEEIRTSSANPPRSLYPRNIGIKMRREVDGSPVFAKDRRKTTLSRKTGQLKLGESFYAIPEVGIFRRKDNIGPKVRGQRGEPLWWFSKRVRTPARLRLWETAEQVFNRFAVSYAAEAVDMVITRGGR